MAPDERRMAAVDGDADNLPLGNLLGLPHRARRFARRPSASGRRPLCSRSFELAAQSQEFLGLGGPLDALMALSCQFAHMLAVNYQTVSDDFRVGIRRASS
jgi:hypothetical protein